MTVIKNVPVGEPFVRIEPDTLSRGWKVEIVTPGQTWVYVFMGIRIPQGDVWEDSTCLTKWGARRWGKRKLASYRRKVARESRPGETFS